MIPRSKEKTVFFKIRTRVGPVRHHPPSRVRHVRPLDQLALDKNRGFAGLHMCPTPHRDRSKMVTAVVDTVESILRNYFRIRNDGKISFFFPKKSRKKGLKKILKFSRHF